MKAPRPILALCAALVCAAGCSTWLVVGGPYSADALGLAADLPDGWMRYRDAKDGAVVMTYDGIPLDYINLYRISVDEELRNTKRRFARDMLPQEAAEVELDNIRLAKGVTNFQLVDNRPASVDGRACYRLMYSYRKNAGRERAVLHYGCMIGEWMYGLRFEAAAQHYFDEHVAAFEELCGTVRFAAGPRAPSAESNRASSPAGARTARGARHPFNLELRRLRGGLPRAR